MKRILIGGLLLLTTSVVSAQNCAQTLRLAQSTYDQGRLHELPGLMKGCLSDRNKDGFSKQEKVTAYKLLTMAFLYLEEPEKADSSMLMLLKTEPFFEPNKEVDPEEFIGLYKTFRTKPIFTIGVKVGPNISMANIMSNYYTAASSIGSSEYSTKIGLQLGLVVEKDLFQNSRGKILPRLTAAPEIIFTPRTFGIAVANALTSDKGGNEAKFEALENQSWIDLNALVQYKLKKDRSRFNTYVTAGPAISYLLSATRQEVFTRKSGNVTSGPDIPIEASLNKLVFSVVVGVGAKLRLGSVYLTADVRYQYGLSNIVKTSARTNYQNTFDYANQFNDYSINNIAVMIGGSKPIFRPKKKLHKRK